MKQHSNTCGLNGARGGRRNWFSKTGMTLLVALLGLGLASADVRACGWWGDGEGDEDDAIEVDGDGRPIQSNALQIPNIPQRENGAGIAIQSPTRANRLASGAVLKIAGLKTAGFNLLVDLDAEGDEAAEHRRETEGLGLDYINLPIPHILPSPSQMTAFATIIESQSRYPIAIYADETQTLAALWTMYRFSKLKNVAMACKEGRALGLNPANERYLIERFEKQLKQ